VSGPGRRRRVCVFCGSSPGRDPVFAAAARACAEALRERGLGLVYGGGTVGMMGALADRMVELGGEVIGVIPEFLVDREVAHPRIADMRIVSSMHERKVLMAELADAFVALPGGWGTLEEFVEVLTWRQLGLHAKPLGVVSVDGYFDSLAAFQEHAVASGFIPADFVSSIVIAETSSELLDRLAVEQVQGGHVP
jgi:uncharacterized protein (TIGR00730 family)